MKVCKVLLKTQHVLLKSYKDGHTGKQGPYTLEDPGPEDPGLLKTQDPRGSRAVKDLGPLRTQDPRGLRTFEDPGLKMKLFYKTFIKLS